MGERKSVGKGTKDFQRKILEAIRIRTLNPKLNRDKGLELDLVWDNLLAIKGGGGKWKFFFDVTKIYDVR